MSHINVAALFEESHSILDAYANFSQDLRSAHESFVKEVKKRARRPGPFVVPTIRLPNPPNFNNSLNPPANCSDVLGSNEPPVDTPPGSKPGRRPARGAALRARQGVADSYKLMSMGKLRRPSNFDSTKSFQPMPTIPGTPAHEDTNYGLRAAGSASYFARPTAPIGVDDVFKKPPLPADCAPSGSSKRPSRATKAEKSTVNATYDISSSEDPGSEVQSTLSNNSQTTRSLRAAGSASYFARPTAPVGVDDVFKKPPLPADCVPSRSSTRPSRATKAEKILSTVDATYDISSSEDSGSEESKGVRTSKRGRPSKRKNTDQRISEIDRTRAPKRTASSGTEESKGVRSSKRGRASKRKNTDQRISEIDRTSRSRAPKRTANSANFVIETDDCSDSPSELKKTFKKSRMKTASASTMSDEIDVEFIEPRPLDQMDKQSLKSETETSMKKKTKVASTTMPDEFAVKFIEPNPVEQVDEQSLNSEIKTSKKKKTKVPSAAVANDVDVEFIEPNPVEQVVEKSLKSERKTSRKNESKTASVTVLDEVDVEFIEPNPVEQADKMSLKSETKQSRKNERDLGCSAMVIGADIQFIEPDVPVEQVDASSLRTRTKTIRKNKVDLGCSAMVIEADIQSIKPDVPVEQVDASSLRTRTKTIRKNKVDLGCPAIVIGADIQFIEPGVPVEQVDASSLRTRTKTIRKNKVAEESSKLGSTFCVPSTADLGSAAEVGAAVGDPDTMSKECRRSSSCPETNIVTGHSNKETVKMSDPMDTLDLPGSSQCFASDQDSNKRQQDPGDNPVEELVASIVQNAPRTRSKMKAMAESRSRSEELCTPGQGKENSGCGRVPLNFIIGSVIDGVKHATPLATLNMISPRSKTTGSAARNKPARFVKEPIREEKVKLLEARKKEEEALKKKKELMQLKKQEIRNQRETKIKKVTESRVAVEKEKMLLLEKEKKEREEKEKQAKAEMMRLKEEALLKKKLLNQQKAQEAEERRQKEEQLRLAKLREQEEEQRKAAEARQRQLEEAERLAALRKQQLKEEEQTKLLEKEKAKEKVKHPKAAKDVSDPDDYGIVDDDGDEKETKPRRPIPKWAEKEPRTKQLLVQTSIAHPVVRSFFNVEVRSPNLREIFGREAFIRPRTSSAVWNTPPPLPPSSP